jgi:hypothetical protein
MIPYEITECTIEKYNIRRVLAFTKFLILLRQKRDFEILLQSISMCGLKQRYSSKRTPRSLKLFSLFSKEILSIGDVNEGSSGRPISVQL